MLAVFLIAFSGLPLWPTMAQTLQKQDAMRGVAAVELLVEELNSAASDCGITEELIKSAVLGQLATSKLRTTSGQKNLILYINVTGLYVSDTVCAASAQLQAYSYQPVALAVTGKEAWARVVLWQTHGILSAGRADVRGRLANSLGTYTKEFITAWTKSQ